MKKRAAYLVYFEIDPSRPVGDSAGMLQNKLMEYIPNYHPVVYVATSHYQPDISVRRAFELHVNLDPEPGIFHTTESAHHYLRHLLSEVWPHRGGMISVAPESLQQKD